MLCRTCTCMLRGGKEQAWRGIHDLAFDHHTRTESLRKSSEAGCSICVALTKELRHEIDLLNDQDVSIEPKLSELRHGKWEDSGVYRLDFVLEKKRTRTFILTPSSSDWTGNMQGDTVRWLRTPKSCDTSSDEVFRLAYSWIKKCTCAKSWDPSNATNRWYPKRLLDLRNIRLATGLQYENGTIRSMNAEVDNTVVKLIETCENEWNKLKGRKYVTLSHCWGTPRSAQGQLKLTAKTEATFKDPGIKLRSFSKSFRDAIIFACRIPEVDYLWIDSMCIIQRTSEPNESQAAAEQDWLEQSRLMHKVYRRSYLNISATAAVDSDKGLFFPREPESLWEDEVNLNIVGLQGQESRVNGDPIKRCTVVDVSFWEELVEKAPVNQRAWVFQERLMAPRVLHFCANQVAWECSEWNDAEGHPEGVELLVVKSGTIVNEGRFKSLTLEDGKCLRDIRLNGLVDPDRDMENLYFFELWKRIVEVYSRTKLTMPRDKLIAIAGIARLLSETLLTNKKARDNKITYVVGMWSQYLESQLLWRVELEQPVKGGLSSNHATRHPHRAPSFSWACLDVPQGIVYAEATDYKGKDEDYGEKTGHLWEETEPLLFKVEHYFVDWSHSEDEFGVIEGGNAYLMLKVQYLRPIILRKLERALRVSYAWRLSNNEPLQEEYANVYLDAPKSDTEIFSKGSGLYVMPAAWGDRTVKKSSRYLMCLLLKHEGERAGCKRFKRVGLTKLSSYREYKGQRAVLERREEETIFLE